MSLYEFFSGTLQTDAENLRFELKQPLAR